MSKRCHDCGQLLQLPVINEPRPWFWVDGTSTRLCATCVRDTVLLQGIQVALERVHRAAHGYEVDACPTCVSEAMSVTWRAAAEFGR